VPHKVLVVVGGRGGAGATTLTRNLASAAVARGVRAEHAELDAFGLSARRSVDYFLVDPAQPSDAEGLADYLVLVATPDEAGIRGVYLALKRFRAASPELPAGVIVNRVACPGNGATLGARIASAAQAFICGPDVDVLGWVLKDAEAAAVDARGRPFVAVRPGSRAAAGIRLCARRLWSRWPRRWKVLAA
jgi:MinD-like ATPase involved in chromosome partitioning or flagellar assembly